MNVCSKCGTLNEDIDKHCKKCGNEMASFTTGSVVNEGDEESAKIKLYKYIEEKKIETKQEMAGADPVEVEEPREEKISVQYDNYSQVTEFGMKWYKFVLWVYMPLSFLKAIWDLFSEIKSNSILGTPGYYYGYNQGFINQIKNVGWVYVAGILIGIVLLFVTWTKMFNLKRGLIGCYVCTYILKIAAPIIYISEVKNMLSIEVNDTYFSGYYIGVAFIPLLMMIINLAYFKNRESLFVN